MNRQTDPLPFEADLRRLAESFAPHGCVRSLWDLALLDELARLRSIIDAFSMGPEDAVGYLFGGGG